MCPEGSEGPAEEEINVFLKSVSGASEDTTKNSKTPQMSKTEPSAPKGIQRIQGRREGLQEL